MNTCFLAICLTLWQPQEVLEQRDQVTRLTLQVEGVTREAWIYVPPASNPPQDSEKQPLPLLFAFHGHGGQARRLVQRFGLQEHWPEAIVVYMQGLPTPGKYDPEGRRPGWQHRAGEHNDRDLKFFDRLLAQLRSEHPIDNRRIYATGHSNGGGFTYLLAAERPALLAAIAPSAAGAGGQLRKLKPIPTLHLAGKADQVVPFTNQQRTINAVKRINACQAEGTQRPNGTWVYSSTQGTPLVTFIHEGGHAYLKQAPKLTVDFFKEHQRR